MKWLVELESLLVNIVYMDMVSFTFLPFSFSRSTRRNSTNARKLYSGFKRHTSYRGKHQSVKVSFLTKTKIEPSMVSLKEYKLVIDRSIKRFMSIEFFSDRHQLLDRSAPFFGLSCSTLPLLINK